MTKTWFLCVFVTAALLSTHVYSKAQPSPLSGQGYPQPETTDIYVSSHLLRLLDVNPRQYQFSASVVYGISWRDYSAAEKILQDTQAVANRTKVTCNTPCNFNRLPGYRDTVSSCCDSIFLPTFAFVNNYDFPTAYSPYINQIIIGPDSQVLWLISLTGTFFTPLKSRFPFESDYLYIAVWKCIQFFGLFFGCNNNNNSQHHLQMEYAEPPNPRGINIQIPRIWPGSAGPNTFYEFSLSDSSPFFNVDGININVVRGNAVMLGYLLSISIT